MSETRKKGASKKGARAPAKKVGRAKATGASAASAAPPTTTDAARFFGVTLTKPLTTSQVRRLRKALPGYSALLDNVAAQLEQDKGALNLKSPTPSDLLQAQAKVEGLMAREAVAEAVYLSIYHQRLQADDEAMDYLFTISRRVESRAEEDPDLIARWNTLRRFLAKFRPGRTPVANPVKDDATTTEEPVTK